MKVASFSENKSGKVLGNFLRSRFFGVSRNAPPPPPPKGGYLKSNSSGLIKRFKTSMQKKFGEKISYLYANVPVCLKFSYLYLRDTEKRVAVISLSDE